MPTHRETVLDRKVHLYETLQEVPDLPPLCPEMGVRVRRVPVEGGTLYCETQGAGTPLVLLNGGPGCGHHLFHPTFSRAAEFAQVVYYDQRGTGQSDPDPTGERYALAQAVEDLDHLRRELGFERWVVLGHSYGGFLAQCYALAHPDRVLGLVLVCAAFAVRGVEVGPSRQWDFMTPEERARIKEIRGSDAPEPLSTFNAYLNGDWKRQNFYRPTEDLLARMARYWWRSAPGFQERINADWWLVDHAGKFDDSAPPTLLVEARWDLTWNTDKPQLLQQLHPRARLAMFERAGHSPFEDEPEAFFATLASFLTEI